LGPNQAGFFYIYSVLKNDFEQHENMWLVYPMIKVWLCSLGFVDAWIYQGVGDDKLFRYLVKQKLDDQFI
jgi:hypothetical protein